MRCTMQWFSVSLYQQTLSVRGWKAARQPVVLTVTPSTNDVARHHMAQGVCTGTVVVAREQKAGRGRMERSWASSPGGLWFSLILRPQRSPEQVVLLPLTVAVAMASALTDATEGLPIGLKWPNDLMVKDKKIGGILMERDGHGLVVGVGVNVNQRSFASLLDQKAISVFQLTGTEVSLERLLAGSMNAIYRYCREWEDDGGQATLEAWRHHSVTLGREVRVSLPGRQVKGKAIDVDDGGSLLVDTAEGTVRITAGDVTLLRQA